jgi:hypothetical protein
VTPLIGAKAIGTKHVHVGTMRKWRQKTGPRNRKSDMASLVPSSLALNRASALNYIWVFGSDEFDAKLANETLAKNLQMKP